MTRASVRLSDLDPVLGPVAAKHRDALPRRVALALFVRGLAAAPPIPPGRVALWASSRLADRPDVVQALAADRRRELVAAASWSPPRASVSGRAPRPPAAPRSGSGTPVGSPAGSSRPVQLGAGRRKFGRAAWSRGSVG